MSGVLPTTEDLIYAAGLIDGEGCVSAHYDSQNRLELRVVVGMTNRDVVVWLYTTFGGYLREKKAHNIKAKPLWQWHLRNKQCQSFLELVKPYLKVKQQQAEVGLALTETLGSPGIPLPERMQLLRYRLKLTLNELNQKGVKHA